MTCYCSSPPVSSQRVLWLSSSSLLLGLWLAVSPAEVRTTLTPDGSLGTTVTSNGTHHLIGGGTRPGNGSNLFHSFDRFSVGTKETVRFEGAAGIQNILSRVTGGQRSEINGTLQSTANLYVLNPSGVVFGPNATLDVKGAFHVSTADYLRLADGARFVARLSEQSTLSAAPPEAFGFLGPSAAAITIDRSTLPVPPGETLSIVGGDLTIQGNFSLTTDMVPTLGAHGGRIHLASVASAGEVVLPPAGESLDLETGSFTRMGQLTLTHEARVTVSSLDRHHAGAVVIRAGTLMLTGEAVVRGSTENDGPGGRVSVVASDVRLEQGGRIVTPTSGRGAGGEITVQAGTLTLTGEGDRTGQLSRLDSSSAGAGRAGRVRVVASDVRLEQGARLEAVAQRGGGDGGEIMVRTGTLTLQGRSRDRSREMPARASTESRIDVGTQQGGGGGGRLTVVANDVRLEEGGRLWARTEGRGAGGVIEVQAERLTLTGDAQIDGGSSRSGQGGTVSVVAHDVRLAEKGRIAAEARGAGPGGSITVQVGTLMLTEQARITGSTHGAGQGGAITVWVSEVLVAQGSGPEPARIASDTQGRGQAGRVVVSAPTLRLDNGRIQAVVDERGEGAGRGGEVEVQGNTITLTRGSRISSSSFGTGRGGDVTVRATEAISLEGSEIGSRANGRGDAGRVTVAAPTIALQAGGTITAAGGRETRTGLPGQGAGGEIVVQAGTLTLTGGAEISGSTQGDGRGGRVAVTASDAIVIIGQRQETTPSRPSRLASSTQGHGQGGDLYVGAPRIDLRDGGTIEATTSADGPAGNIVIQAGETFHSAHGRVTTESTQAGGGTLQLTAGTVVWLRDSQVSTAVRSGTGTGGNITLTAPAVVLARSHLTANAAGGPGGNITVRADVLLHDPASGITASSERSLPGEINIQGALTDLSGLLAPFPSIGAETAVLLHDPCAARLREGTVSTFVVRERASLPPGYEGLLPPRLYAPPRLRTSSGGARDPHPPATASLQPHDAPCGWP